MDSDAEGVEQKCRLDVPPLQGRVHFSRSNLGMLSRRSFSLGFNVRRRWRPNPLLKPQQILIFLFCSNLSCLFEGLQVWR